VTLGPIALVGGGPKALALAEELATCGEFAGVTVYGRQAETPDHPVFSRGMARYVFGLEPFERDTVAVILAVAETAVPEIALSVAGQGAAPAGCAAFHLSPVLPTEALAPLHGQGYALGAFHPMGAAPDAPTQGATITGGFVAVTGSPSAVSVARRITDVLSAEVLEVPAGRRPMVDAATVMASAYLDPLMDLSRRLMERAGIAADDATPALASVARAALGRIVAGETAPTPDNPVLEGDVERLALHLRALDAEERRLYALFASEILRLEADALDRETRVAMEELLERHRTLEPTSIG